MRKRTPEHTRTQTHKSGMRFTQHLCRERRANAEQLAHRRARANLTMLVGWCLLRKLCVGFFVCSEHFFARAFGRLFGRVSLMRLMFRAGGLAGCHHTMLTRLASQPANGARSTGGPP